MLYVVCLLASCLALFILPVLTILIYMESPTFTLPKHQRKNAATSCVIATILYALLGSFSLFKLVLEKRHLRFIPEVGTYNRNSITRQVEMRPLLGSDQSDSSDQSSPERNLTATSQKRSSERQNNTKKAQRYSELREDNEQVMPFAEAPTTRWKRPIRYVTDKFGSQNRDPLSSVSLLDYVPIARSQHEKLESWNEPLNVPSRI